MSKGGRTTKVQLTPEADNAYVTATVRFGNFWWKARFCKVGGWDAESLLQLSANPSEITRCFNDAVARGKAWVKLGSRKPWVKLPNRKELRNAKVEA